MSEAAWLAVLSFFAGWSFILAIKTDDSASRGLSIGGFVLNTILAFHSYSRIVG